MELKKNDAPWLYDVSAHIGQQALVDLDRAFNRFFEGLKAAGTRSGFPRFKRKGERDSARLYEVTLEERHIRLPDIGRIRLKETRSASTGGSCRRPFAAAPTTGSSRSPSKASARASRRGRCAVGPTLWVSISACVRPRSSTMGCARTWSSRSGHCGTALRSCGGSTGSWRTSSVALANRKKAKLRRARLRYKGPVRKR